jgi:hypothetical protein
MLFKKSFSLLLVIIFICTSVLAQFSWAAEASQATLLEDLSQIEMATSRAKQLKEFIISGTTEEPSVIFKINASQWILEEKITSQSLIIKIESIENVLFGKTSSDVLAMRAESIFGVCFKEGRPQVEEVVIPAGTLMPIRFLSTLSSKDNKTGEIFNFQIAENILQRRLPYYLDPES